MKTIKSSACNVVVLHLLIILSTAAGLVTPVTESSSGQVPSTTGDVSIPNVSTNGFFHDRNHSSVSIGQGRASGAEASAVLPINDTNIRLDYGHYQPESVSRVHDLYALIERSSADELSKYESISVHGYGRQANLTAIVVGIVRRLPNLKELHWEFGRPIPEAILTLLETNHSSCKLFYRVTRTIWDGYSDIDDRESSIPNTLQKASDAILGSPNLYSLQQRIFYGGQTDRTTLNRVHNILTTCANLRCLDLSLEQRGCALSIGQPYEFSFSGRSWRANAPFPPLEELRLSRYALHGTYDGNRWPRKWPDKAHIRAPWNWLPQWVSSNFVPMSLYAWILRPENRDICECGKYPISNVDYPTNVEAWLERMDFSQMRVLSLDHVSGDTITKLSGRANMSSLVDLRIGYTDCCGASALEAFLRNSTRSLTQLHVRNTRFSKLAGLVEAVTTKHPDLKILKVHEAEDMRLRYCSDKDSESMTKPACHGLQGSKYGRWHANRLSLTAPDIVKLMTSLNKLTAIDIDTDRTLLQPENQTTLRQMVDAVASSQSLQDLTLRFESPTFVSVREGAIMPTNSWMGLKNDLPEDPLINNTRLTDLFVQIQNAKRRMRVAGKTLTELKNLTVLVGEWDDRGAGNGRPTDKVVLGRFECHKAKAVNATAVVGETLERRVHCYGGLVWPEYWRRWISLQEMQIGSDQFDDFVL